MKKALGLVLVGAFIIFISICNNCVVADTSTPGDDAGFLFGWPPGSFFAADSPTDLAIDGLGYFILSDPSNTEERYYTRFGAFTFNDDGNFVSSHGYFVQGWELELDPLTGEAENIGSITDIKIATPLISSASESTTEYAFYESSISIDETGVISTMDTDGHTIILYRLALAKFQDTHGLSNSGDDIFQETSSSGNAIISSPGSNGFGSLESYTLEDIESNPSYETDISVDGDGLFYLRTPNSDSQAYYASQDAFRFNNNGDLVSSNDYVVQGWQLERNPLTSEVENIGSITGIQLVNFTSPPKATDSLSVIANFDSGGTNNTAGGPTSLSEAWDGDLGREPHIDDSAYEYQITVKVYDSLGSTHDITIYFDKGDIDQRYEFIVTCNPAEDERLIFDDAEADAGLGLLGRGCLDFTADNVLTDMDFEQYVGNSGGLASANTSWPTAAPTVTGAYSGTATLPATITIAATGTGIIGTDAIPTDAGFTIPSTYVAGDYVQGPDGMIFQFNVGDTVAVENKFDVTVTAGRSDDLLDANNWALMDGDYTNQHYTFSADFFGGTTPMDVELNFGAGWDGTAWVPDALSSSYYSSASTTISQTSNGHTSQDLVRAQIDQTGIIMAYYSEGLVSPRFRVALASFQNETALEKVSDNLYRETTESGTPTTSAPNENGFGTLSFEAQNSTDDTSNDSDSGISCFITSILQ